MNEETVVNEIEPKALRRIRKREERQTRGPWKWQLVDLMHQLQGAILELSKKIEKLDMRNETARKLSEAGKKSAAARKAKFGTASPTRNTDFKTPLSEKQKARQLMQEAIRVGELVRPAYCSNCLREGKVDGHHEDYSKPLSITWLCEQCHSQIHTAAVKKTCLKPKPPTAGSLVWAAYEMAFQTRWKVPPLRNARANKHCSELAALVGAEPARELVCYYVGRNDATYLKAKHPLGLLVMEAQKLSTEMQTGQAMTGREAQQLENAAMNDHVVRQYAAKQAGIPEQDREPVHVKEVENADSRTVR